MEIAKKGYEVVILEQAEDILQGTSARTPGRMGLGYHYFDFDTAKFYMEQTLAFMKKYSDCFLGNDSSESYLRNGRYFIVKDSLVKTQNLMHTYDKVSLKYEQMARSDPSNKVFNSFRLHRALHTNEYKNDVDISNISFAIETQERLLDWMKFSLRIRSDIAKYPNIKIILNSKIADVSMTEDRKFILSSKESNWKSVKNYFDFVVNCSWQNIDLINEKLGLGDVKSRKEDPIKSSTSRLKLLAEIEIPRSLQNCHSMFFCIGPHAMFSNLGNGIGRITYAPVTNFQATSDIKMPDIFERWLTKGLNEDESAKYGKKL